MKKIIIVLVALALLGGGGGAAYFFKMKDKGAEAEVETAEAEGQSQEYDEVHKGDRFYYVPIRTLIVPIVDGNDLSQTLYVAISLEVETEREYYKVRAVEPQLMDAFIIEASGLLNDPKVRQGNLVNIPLMKKQFLKRANEIVENNIVKSVAIEAITQAKSDK